MDSADYEYGQFEDFYGHNNEFSSFVNGGEFVGLLLDKQILNDFGVC